MNKIFKTLLITLSLSAITAQATQVWLQNNYGKQIIVRFNRTELTIGNGHTISLGSFGDLESLSIRTNTFGSFFSNILYIKDTIWRGLPSAKHNATIVIRPNTFTWDIKVEYEIPNKTNIIAK